MVYRGWTPASTAAPLATVFTPPPRCTDQPFTMYHSVIDGSTDTEWFAGTPTIYREYVWIEASTLTCYPTGFYTSAHPIPEHGEAPVYSPGWACPSGYSTLRTYSDSGPEPSLNIYCCPSGYSSTYLGWCESEYSSSTTAVFYADDLVNVGGGNHDGNTSTTITTVPPGVAAARMVSLQYRDADTSLLSSLSEEGEDKDEATTFATVVTTTLTPTPTPTVASTTTPDSTSELPEPSSTALGREQTVRCLQKFVPMGVLGFYSWLSDFLTVTINALWLLSLIIVDRNRFGFLSFAIGLIMTGKTIWTLYLNGRALDQCTGNKTFGELYGGAGGFYSNVLILRAASAGVCIVASFFTMTGIGFAIFGPALAALAVYFFGYIFYLKETVFTQLAEASDIRGPILAVSIPMLVVLIVFLAASAITFATNHPGSGWTYLGIALIVPFHLWAVGVGHVILGSFVDDAWGEYILKEWIGKIEVVLLSVAPVGSFLLGLVP